MNVKCLELWCVSEGAWEGSWLYALLWAIRNNSRRLLLTQKMVSVISNWKTKWKPSAGQREGGGFILVTVHPRSCSFILETCLAVGTWWKSPNRYKSCKFQFRWYELWKNWYFEVEKGSTINQLFISKSYFLFSCRVG